MKFLVVVVLALAFSQANGIVFGGNGDYPDPAKSLDSAKSLESIPASKQNDVPEIAKEKLSDEASKDDKETALDTALVQNDSHEDELNHLQAGNCHWGVGVWFKPGVQIRCSCMKCTCAAKSQWNCAYEFAFCPYFYCGNTVFNPLSQICCCGKVYRKNTRFSCCGHLYYNTTVSKCCSYATIKPKKANCPRFKI
ncbi:uncharacterized protein LOC114538179 isoform X2 [Dendronephthya gigantea]|uniref:uncharacterized protein LOC114538179 isoform X2 n=1 Tax=Dendronephthya gigantea TaxID=151771 RepID=UPI00106BB33F|nr:uncharacterized protein LOC114538179 isoform X2 [Dendronephthya gigantea]